MSKTAAGPHRDEPRDAHTKPAALRVDPKPAPQALVDIVNENPGEITVLAIAPLTNTAMAMILDPEWASKVKQLVIMSGAFGMPNVLQEPTGTPAG